MIIMKQSILKYNNLIYNSRKVKRSKCKTMSMVERVPDWKDWFKEWSFY